MEDILASIRRILNEDEVAPGSPAGGCASRRRRGLDAAECRRIGRRDDDGVLVLDEAMLVHEPEPPPACRPLPAADARTRRGGSLRREPSRAGRCRPRSPSGGADGAGEHGRRRGVGRRAAAHAVAASGPRQVHRGGPTIEDLVREEVRPLLKDWLDNHLPPLVERLVRQEIERVDGPRRVLAPRHGRRRLASRAHG